jgi:hypothetical protein
MTQNKKELETPVAQSASSPTGQKSQHTPGPWEWNELATIGKPDNGDWQYAIQIARILPIEPRVSRNEREANARLIAEAGTVATETGLTPRQLADQRAELLEALTSAYHILASISSPDTRWGNTSMRKIREILSKAEGRQ